MRNVFKTVLFVTLLFFAFSSANAVEQDKKYTSKQALSIFNKGNYIEAEEAYVYLLKQYPREANYNFYMGICQLNNKSDISGAIKKLNYARVKNVSRNVYYYLGKAHRANFQFDEAIRNFSTYIKYASSKDKRIAESKILIEECRTAQRLSAKIYELSVIDKSVSHRDSILDLYYPSNDVGSIMLNNAFFDSGVKPDGTLFITERKDVVYYTSNVSEEDSLGIFKMERLLDGWGESEILGSPVNSEYNDAYPFIETDGVTLYFASDRPGGFGGYDIYKTYFDVETQSYVEPINLGVPFNSSEDDFLFVADEFNGVAWFASTRATNGDEVMVYSVKWDGTQVRNMAEDANQIKVAGELRLSSETDNESDVGFTYSDNKRRVSVAPAFDFDINDTIKYTQFNDFLSEEALSIFKVAHGKALKKDSLSLMMREERASYATARSPEEKNRLVNRILEFETQVYGLEDDIKEHYIKVRYLELQEIKKQIAEGTYDAGSNKDNPQSEPNVLVVPAKYNYLIGDEFETHSIQQEELYAALFSDSDIEELQLADSLYVWANLLNMESSNLLEKSASVEEQTHLQVKDILKKNKEEVQQSNSSELIDESKEIKLLSAKLYHKSLDKKYPIYWLKLQELSKTSSEDNKSSIEQLAAEGNAYFKEGNDALSQLGGVSLAEYEKAGAIKRTGIEKQEKALRKYYENENVSNIAENAGTQKSGTVQKSYSELHKGEDVYVAPVKAKEETVSTNSNSEYRVQIGVFRNAPKQESLAQIPPTTTIEIKDKGLTKYMSGHFTTEEEAQAAIPEIERAGFKGAYVVYVNNGVVTKLP